ncbi:MAG: hypothetical protein ACE5NW_13385 [Acidiferrobacterales bacterium]
MTYEIEHEQTNMNHVDVLAAWTLYLVVIFGLTGYHFVQLFLVS